MEYLVENKINGYPDVVKARLYEVRGLIYLVCDECDAGNIVETLKWGEPSYSVKYGSPIRMDWKQSNPNYFSVYFNCNTRLVETFKEVYGSLFIYEGNRAIVFHVNDEIPIIEFKHCLSLALCYKKIKHLPLLGLC